MPEEPRIDIIDGRPVPNQAWELRHVLERAARADSRHDPAAFREVDTEPPQVTDPPEFRPPE